MRKFKFHGLDHKWRSSRRWKEAEHKCDAVEANISSGIQLSNDAGRTSCCRSTSIISQLSSLNYCGSVTLRIKVLAVCFSKIYHAVNRFWYHLFLCLPLQKETHKHLCRMFVSHFVMPFLFVLLFNAFFLIVSLTNHKGMQFSFSEEQQWLFLYL